MHIGYIGLGKMGSNMVLRLIEKGHKVSAYDVDQKAMKRLARHGVKGNSSIVELVSGLKGPRTIWIMVPHKFVDSVLAELRSHLKKGDTIIEGGNSPFKLSIKRAQRMKKLGVHFLDVGVSGGPKGAREGACMMVGGTNSSYKRYTKLFRDLCVPKGYGYMGSSGAGHFVKMVHNGIEYGMMQAIAEGFSLMRASRDFKLNLTDVARVYRYGSVISSSLMDWMHSGLKMYGNDLEKVSSSAVGTGEGKWTTEIAHQLGVSDKVIHEALRARARSKKKSSFEGKVIMTLRNQFGGHSIKDN